MPYKETYTYPMPKTTKESSDTHIVHDVASGWIITLYASPTGTDIWEWVDLELIGKNLYQVINRPAQERIEIVLNAIVKETNALRMSDVMLFTDECRTYIKLVYGITLRKT